MKDECERHRLLTLAHRYSKACDAGLLQRDKGRFMADVRQEDVEDIIRLYFQAGRIDAGMAAEVNAFPDFPVYKKPDLVFRIVHQPHDADGAGFAIQVSDDVLPVGKGQPGAVYLL